ncbi:MAG: hypothetical protein P8R54_26795 [Myxococcota bacterium]|nr:hypothetical protein [Myxococcota bacterium]
MLLSLLACAALPADSAPSSGTSLQDSAAPADTAPPSDTAPSADLNGSWTFDTDTVTVIATAAAHRTYTLTTTHPQRDHGPTERAFTEQPGDPLLRSGNLLTDALFALAVEEARLNAVSQISDGAFEGAVDCECYQTGALWNWVWTRDIAYATELSLGWLDPERAANSLLFKLSERKSGGDLQIIQDTGTGGSWPVSTDRVAWARGAMAVLRYVDHPELRAAAIEAMVNTAALDRLYAFDARDGLYRGETSFLDWREQTYPQWMAGDVVHIAMSKSLSTNLDHLFLLRALETLTGEAHGADDLAAAIDAAFWSGSAYRSYLTTELDPAPAQQDLLATALAVLDLNTHPEALAAYPHGPAGPPVIWPQQQRTPIYHNRSVWPFVTAYAVIAARKADNGAVLDAGLDALVRGAALNLSHMENFELETGANWRDDGEFSGPVVNSRRQLWSVAGFLGAIAHGVFGVTGEDGVLRADPIRPGGWLEPGATLQIGDFTAEIGTETLSAGAVAAMPVDDWQDLYGAAIPEVSLAGSGDTVILTFAGEHGATFDVYRDGVLAAASATSPWTDTTATTACYTVVARLIHPGQPSSPQCWWGDDSVRIQSAYAPDFTASGGAYSTDHGRDHYGNWGAPEHTLTATLTPLHTGEHLVQLVYGNGAGGTDTGITAAVKWVEVVVDGAVVAEGPITMPHLGDWALWADSSFLPVSLTAGQSATVTIRDGINMSYFAHYTAYVGGRGGGGEPSNDVNIAELKLLFLQ